MNKKPIEQSNANGIQVFLFGEGGFVRLALINWLKMVQ
jgi:hypothetical protein